jgi:hypothetical protein
LNYCKGCQSEIDKNGSTTNGTVDQRLACELMEFKDPKGRKPVAYMKIMEKQKLTREQVETEAGKQNLLIDEMHFVAGEKKEKKKKVETVTVAVEDDLLAQLMDDLEEDSVDLETLEAPSSQQQADEKAVKEAEKAEKALKKQQQADEKAAKEAEVALKKQQQADEKAAKEAEVALKKQQQADEKAAKDAEKAAKAQKIADEKAAKAQQIADEKAAKEAEKAAKAQQIADEKAAKAQKIADEKAEKAQQIADEKAAKEQKIAEEKALKKQQQEEEKALKKKATTPEKKQKEAKSAEPVAEPVSEPVAAAPKKVTVKRITIEGKQYLKTADNLLYNPETKEEMGIYDPVTNTIKALPDDSEDELSEDNMSDVE